MWTRQLTFSIKKDQLLSKKTNPLTREDLCYQDHETSINITDSTLFDPWTDSRHEELLSFQNPNTWAPLKWIRDTVSPIDRMLAGESLKASWVRCETGVLERPRRVMALPLEWERGLGQRRCLQLNSKAVFSLFWVMLCSLRKFIFFMVWTVCYLYSVTMHFS